MGFPEAAAAHVKWFTPTNVHNSPLPLSDVLSARFVSILVAAVLLVFLGFLLDGWVARRWPKILTSGNSLGEMEERIVRAATGVYFACMAQIGLTILTPELKGQATWLNVIQFMIAFFLIWRRTCFLSGSGILVLYVYAIAKYGMFHLIDYIFIPCLAVYLASITIRSPRLRLWREPLLTGGLAVGLGWTAIEKFLYPQWTAAVVAIYPSLALGLPVPLVVTIAGFVEFTLAFYLITGSGLLRLGGAGYMSIFIAAMPVFGKLDVFGHLVIIATLSIVVLRGTTPMQDAVRPKGHGLVVDSARICGLYLASLVGFFAAYYAMQRT